MKITYISGKITGLDLLNTKERFLIIKNYLEREGKEAITPFEVCSDLPSDAIWEDYMMCNIKYIMFHKPDMFFMNNWRASKGGKIEHEIAKIIGLKRYYEYLSSDDILQHISEKLRIETKKIISVSRKRTYRDARFVFCYLAKKYTKLSLEKIGLYINRDHSSVIHALKQCDNIYDVELQQKIKLCEL
ncbi:MAG: DUF4406 domain-containing protein [Candidatus Lokiarchaeota archaeon]|nr:DUF4406 domain-containing protein [Candidatus Lokiarchaeota archaeon]